MRCARPYRIGVLEHGCGQCMPCRINRSRLWVGRLLLESLLHKQSLFVTLTYKPESLPEGGNLVPRHLQVFMKRLREKIEPLKVRFYGVGEYGGKSGRPHYHVVLFGSCDQASIEAAWPHGFVHVGLLSRASAAYTAGYVMKGFTKEGDPRLKGKVPEFCRMSLRPGIGAGATDEMVRVLLTDGGSQGLVRLGDVPSSVRIGGHMMALGRYLRRKIREGVGWLPGVPERELQKAAEVRIQEYFELGIEGVDLLRKGIADSARSKIGIQLSKGIL